MGIERLHFELVINGKIYPLTLQFSHRDHAEKMDCYKLFNTRNPKASCHLYNNQPVLEKAGLDGHLPQWFQGGRKRMSQATFERVAQAISEQLHDRMTAPILKLPTGQNNEDSTATD